MLFCIYISFLTIFLYSIWVFILDKDYLLHMAQLHNYRHFEYKRWLFNINNLLIYKNRYISLTISFLIFLSLNIISKFFLEHQLTNFSSLLNIFKIEPFKLEILKLEITFDFNFLLIYLFFIFIYLYIFYFSSKRKSHNIKKPLVYTKRAIRLKILYWFLFLGILILGFFAIKSIIFEAIDVNINNFKKNIIEIYSEINNENYNIFIKNLYYIYLINFISLYSFFSIFVLSLTPLIMYFAQFFIYPFENLINKKFYNLAKNKIFELKKKGLLVIGITGSYGKTSTKFYLKTILERKYNVLASEASYNTPMGLSKNINERLNENYQIFISEMGARYKNNIDDLVNLCNPDIGILTAVGPAHLETFKTLENIANEKFKLIKKSKIGFINIDNDYIYKKLQNYIEDINKENLNKKDKKTELIVLEKFDPQLININSILNNNIKYIFTYGENVNRKPLILFKNVYIEKDKSIFEIEINEFGNFKFETELLGKHLIQNLVVAVGISFFLDASYNDIFEVIKNIKPVEHRLSIIKPNEMLLILDDAYNSNPHSAKAALDVISGFKDRKKIVVTPGFIELGKFQYKENKNFGRLISQCVDFAIFVGKTNRKALIEGYKSYNNNENFYLVDNLNEASKLLPTLVNSKTVVLFENDLPDNYEN